MLCVRSRPFVDVPLGTSTTQKLPPDSIVTACPSDGKEILIPVGACTVGVDVAAGAEVAAGVGVGPGVEVALVAEVADGVSVALSVGFGETVAFILPVGSFVGADEVSGSDVGCGESAAIDGVGVNCAEPTESPLFLIAINANNNTGMKINNPPTPISILVSGLRSATCIGFEVLVSGRISG